MATMVVSALGAALWLPWWLAATWLAAGSSLVMMSALVLDNRFVDTGRAWFSVWLMAGLTLVSSTWFTLLPLALVMKGDAMATLAGVCIAGGLILRGANEFALSKPIGSAALCAIIITAVIGAVWRPMPAAPLEVAVVLINVAMFFGYVFMSASSRRRAEEGMALALEAAEHNQRAALLASEAKTSFLAMMSHEIRTPLNGIVGMAQAMDTAGFTPRQLDQLAVIQTSGAALHAVLNDVLDLTKIEAGKLEAACEPFSPRQVGQAVHDVFAPVAAGRRLDFSLQVSPAAEGLFLGDAPRLRQVIANLVSNALKFTDSGSVQLAIDHEDGTLQLDVIDTGIGIPPDSLDRLFDKFFQIDSSSTRRHDGTGLGLSITRALCELMGGRIEVTSRPGDGARFTVLLPMARAPAAAETGDAPDAQASDPFDADELRVLAAEDNAVNQLVLKTLLEQIGIRPTVVANGEQVLEAWRNQAWDVVLMDVQMPVMDGLAATQAIRRLEAASGRPRTPIIALTANAMAHQVQEYLSADMDGCVAKPIDARDLFSAISTVLDSASFTAQPATGAG